MGTTQSTSTQGPRDIDLLLEEPWRVTMGWGKSVRNTLKSQVEGIHPATKVPSLNILLAGQMASGKSSFINSINNVLNDRVCASRADAGDSAQLLTKKFKKYQFKPDLPFRIYDTMGIQRTDVYINNILQAANGHLPDKYQFTPFREFNIHSPGYIVDPTLADRAHCLAIVIDAYILFKISEDDRTKLRILADTFFQQKIPVFVLLTYLDESSQKVHSDITQMFHSKTARDIVHYTSTILLGITENHIFPIVNYKHQIELDDNIDILLLYALRQMLQASQVYIENYQLDPVPAPVMGPEASITPLSQEEEQGKETERSNEDKAPVEMEFPSITM